MFEPLCVNTAKGYVAYNVEKDLSTTLKARDPISRWMVCFRE